MLNPVSIAVIAVPAARDSAPLPISLPADPPAGVMMHDATVVPVSAPFDAMPVRTICPLTGATQTAGVGVEPMLSVAAETTHSLFGRTLGRDICSSFLD